MADLPHHGLGPLVTIRFVWRDWRRESAERHPSDADIAAALERAPLRDDLTIVRYWHHVPRDGEHVTLHEGDQTYDGNVRAVWWNDDGTITIPLS